MRVSVIIPIYGVEKFIARSVKSLMEQTLQEVEFIFVNDSTKDRSMEILQSVLVNYPERQQYVKIVNHLENKGLPSARNTGLGVATGDYIFHFDSDDYADVDMLMSLYNSAIQEQADVVWCDYFLTFEKNEKYMKQPKYDNSLDALKGMLIGSMKYNVWNKLVRRDLYVQHQIKFPDGYSMGEDMTMMKLFLFANKVAYIPCAFYHYYQGNANSITAVYTQKHLDALYHNASDIFAYLNLHSQINLDVEIACLKLLMKWTFLLDGKKTSFRKWQQWFPESNAYIGQSLGICRRIRFIEKCAARGHFWIIWLHYWIVCRFYYGIVYR